jgi:ParB family chromosome partitioning protein
VREAEALSQRRVPAGGQARVERPAKPADTVALERSLSDALGLSVTVNHTAQGGKLEIRYRTLEQLDALRFKLTGTH